MTEPEIAFDSIAQQLSGLLILGFIVAGTVVLVIGYRHFRRRPVMHPAVDGALLRRPWRITDVILIILFYILIHALTYPVHSLTDAIDHESDAGLAFQLSFTLVLQALGLVFILWLALRHRGGWRKAFGNLRARPFPALWLAGVIYLAIWPVQLVATPIYHWILQKLDVAIDMQESLLLLTTTDSAAVLTTLLILALVVAPITEELFFRGILLPVFRRRIGIWPAILLSSLIFALIHFHLPSIAGLFIVSVACCLAALWGQSVTPAIWLHALFNGINTLLVFVWQN